VDKRRFSVLSSEGGALPETSINGAGTSLDNHSRWFAAYTMWRHEKRIAARCDRAGIEHFLPLYVVRNTWKNRVTANVHLPLFPNYIWALLPPGGHVALLKLPGVLRIVGNAAGAVPMSPRDMDALRQFVRYDTFLPHNKVDGGDTVRINRGPLKGLEGVCFRRDNLVRFVVTIDLIGKSVAVDLDSTEFERFDPERFSAAESQSASA
jgi:transcription termination/antitermination protein NusG